jgi:ABC-type transport system involved in cytochrome c biogenesis permease subunit
MAISIIGLLYAAMTTAFWAGVMFLGYKTIRLVLTISGVFEADPAASKDKSRK